jgi:hypothetical protein
VINISSNNITITGDTSNSSAGQLLFRTIKSSGLDIVKEDFGVKAARWHFNIMVKPSVNHRSTQ